VFGRLTGNKGVVMSDDKKFGTAQSMKTDSSHCGLRPSKEAMEEGFGVDFSQAKSLLDKNSQTKETIQKKPKDQDS